MLRLLFFLPLLIPPLSWAQTCNGELGRNIYTEGTFGAGPDNIPPDDPGFSNRYVYRPEGEVYDGSYTITNDMQLWRWPPPWRNIYGWHIITSDNSASPNGYFLVVNANNEPGAFYEDEITDLCENTRYAFSIDLHNLIAEDQSEGFNKPDIAVLFDGQEVFQTGNLNESQQWERYSFYFTTKPGQTSLQLQLDAVNPGGLGNDFAVDNIAFKPCKPVVDLLPKSRVVSCEDDFIPTLLEADILYSYFDSTHIQWQYSADGLRWSVLEDSVEYQLLHNEKSGRRHFYRFFVANSADALNAGVCRTLSPSRVIEIIPKFHTIHDTICDGLVYPFGAAELNRSGTYIDTFVARKGCDSIVTLELEVVPYSAANPEAVVQATSCSYTPDGWISIQQFRGGYSPYVSVLNGDRSGPPHRFTGLDSGWYELQITDHFGCESSTRYRINRPDSFAIRLQKNWSVKLGDPVWLTSDGSTPIENYSWLPNGYVDCTRQCDSVFFYPKYSAWVVLEATNANNCISEDSVEILVDPVRNLELYNVFSPNGDGINNNFYFTGEEPNVQEVENMWIYNRWGNEVWHKSHFPINQPAQGWDGRIDGQWANAGTYFFIAEIRFLDDEVITYKGTVTLLR